MKRLLDDPTDEVTRLLIRAAVDHQPPRSSKMRLVAALGMGSAAGLLSSEVLAWLGTSAGKATLALTALGVAAGGVYSTRTEREVPQSHAAPPAMARPATPDVLPGGPAPLDGAETPPLPLQPAPVDRPQSKLEPPPRAREREQASPSTQPQQAQRRLGEETRWVDRMKSAAERGDRATLQHLLTGYAEKFPAGQLQPEVDRIKSAP